MLEEGNQSLWRKTLFSFREINKWLSCCQLCASVSVAYSPNTAGKTLSIEDPFTKGANSSRFLHEQANRNKMELAANMERKTPLSCILLWIFQAKHGNFTF